MNCLVFGTGRMGQELRCALDGGASPALSFAGFFRRDSDNPPSEKPGGIIDFSAPAGTATAAQWAMAWRAPLVSGTTGLRDQEWHLLEQAAGQVPVLHDANMSLGIALMTRLLEQAAARLDPLSWDLEILETHHRDKQDAPSGTALKLGHAAARARSKELESLRHDHMQTPREPGKIGFSVRRGGGVYGEHEASFMSKSEIVSLQHRALNRAVFAEGALQAILWLRDQKPGLYSLQDMLETD